MSSITFTHLRFDNTAESEIVLGGHYAGNNIRNALANTMLYATCPQEQRGRQPSAEHAARCPVCWLLAAEVDPGSVVRAYAVVPPQTRQQRIPAGGRFSFGLTLFGEGWQFLPYIVLAAAEIGRSGVGPGRRQGKGRFRLEEISAFNPLTGNHRQLLQRGHSLVQITPAPVSLADAHARADGLNAQLAGNGGRLSLRFHSPLRLVTKKHNSSRPLRSPQFQVLFQRLLFRIDDLGRQLAGGSRRSREEVTRLNEIAANVRLLENNTRWIDLWSWSGRKQDKTPVGGLVGTATYQAADWGPLLPWLILGQGTQVGKSAVKGLGVYSIDNIAPGYWAWLS